MGKGLSERLHLQLVKLYIYVQLVEILQSTVNSITLRCFKHTIQNYFIKEHFRNLKATTV